MVEVISQTSARETIVARILLGIIMILGEESHQTQGLFRYRTCFCFFYFLIDVFKILIYRFYLLIEFQIVPFFYIFFADSRNLSCNQGEMQRKTSSPVNGKEEKVSTSCLTPSLILLCC